MHPDGKGEAPLVTANYAPPVPSRDGQAPAPAPRSQYAIRDLTSGSIPRNLWFLAWPQVIDGALRVVDQLADMVWAGIFGHRAIAGMGVAQQYVQLGFTARHGIDGAMRAMVARAFGMRNPELANAALFQAATVTFIYGLVLALIGVFLSEPLLRLLGVSDGVVDEGVAYMRLQLIGQGMVGFNMLSAHALSAAGDSFTPMKATALSRVIHFLLSPVLMFGLLGVPHFGLSGAALANIIGHSISMGILFYVLFSGASRMHLRLRAYRFDWPLTRQLLKIGIPASVTGMERSLAQLLVVVLVAPFGDSAVAAFTLTRRVEIFAHMGSQGLGLASGTIVGQSLGAGRPGRARQTILWAAGYIAVLNFALSALIFAFPVAFLSIFNREPEFLEIGEIWLRIQVAGYAVMGIGQIFAQSFNTAGATLFVMIVTLASMWGVELPLGLLLSRGTELGQFGIAWAVVAATVVRLVAFIPYFLSGRWQHVRVFAHEPSIFRTPQPVR